MLSKRDVFARLPTGGGKSLTYQLPALHCNGIVIIISPLKALKNDQMEILKNLNIQARDLISLPITDTKAMCHEIITNPDIKILLITPEKLAKSLINMKRLLDELNLKKKLNFFAIDEAHCIKKWGNDFRPDYLKLG